ncbi:MAG: hypothetical protein KJO32_09040 [Deltaproteobacteria bacterium]|nr:hypothetical protein [Deltaproteobacteria bacterium]
MSEKVYINKNAQDLFPALFEENDRLQSSAQKPQRSAKRKKLSYSSSPRPPNIAELRRKFYTEKSDTNTEIRRALILSADNNCLLVCKKVLQNFKFVVKITPSESDAIESISLYSFSTLVYDSSLGFNDFEYYMRNLAGDKRRNLYYVIIGPELKTLYDLQALSLSANLVVNNSDMKYLDKILKKGFQDYETLFRPFVEIIQANKE